MNLKTDSEWCRSRDELWAEVWMEAWAEGWIVGYADGMREAITQVLTHKFGLLPDTIKYRLESLSFPQLTKLSDDMLDLSDIQQLLDWLNVHKHYRYHKY